MIVSVCPECGDFFESDGGRFCQSCHVIGTAKRRGQQSRHISRDRRAMIAVTKKAQFDESVVCHLCGKREPPPWLDGTWTADHVTPGKQGARLKPAHRGCNSARGNRSLEWFREYLEKEYRK